MKTYLLAASIAVLAFAAPALATTPGNNGGGNGGCGVGQQTNGCGVTSTISPDISVDTQVKPVITTVVAPDIDVSADIRSTNLVAPVTNIAPDIRNTNTSVIAPVISPDINTDVRNTNLNGQDQNQGQLQGQLQGQGQLQSAVSGSSSASSSAANSDQTQTQAVIGSGNSSNTVTGGAQSQSAVGSGNTTNVSVGGDVHEAQRRNPVNTAYAAPLAIGGGVCAYTPVSAAGQFISFGLSGSAAKIDQGCETRATADVFARMGYTFEACLIMVSQGPAARAGLTRDVCQRPVDVVVSAPQPVVQPAPVQPLPAATEAEGERG